MVEFNSVYPDEEDIKIAFERSVSIIQEEIQNLRDINKRLMENHTYIDANKCAEILHCKVSEIPSGLPYYRASRVSTKGILYKLSEVIDFIEERRIPRKSKET